MSAYSCAQVRDLAPELALGILGGAERAEAILHVNGCARCQAVVGEFAEAADALPLLAREVEPPPGFEDRVLATLRAAGRRNVRRWIAAVAVAAAAAAIVSITIVRVVEAGNETTPQAFQAAPVEARMIGAGGRSAGWAYVTNGRSVAVAVDYGVPSGTYSIAVQPRGSSAVTIGRMAVVEGRGSWTGRSGPELGPGATIALIDAAGGETCRGTVRARS
jgi:hypothetical protein